VQRSDHCASWGLLFGILFFVPIAGLAAGTAIGSLTGSLAKVGIKDDFIKSVRGKVTEGTSALFLLTSDAVKDRVVDAMKQLILKSLLPICHIGCHGIKCVTKAVL